jgi:branched-chain amino acid transport system permease protein
MSRRQAAAGITFFALMAALPLILDAAVLSVLTLIFFYAYLGQAWNLTMGFVGLLSLGHALFLGLGGYVTALLLQRYGISPWLGLPVGAALSAGAGAVIGWLGFRFAVRGIFFALLTIAFAEFIRILFDNWAFVGGSGGFFLSAVSEKTNTMVTLRGGTRLYYYVFLVLMAAAFLLCRWLLDRPTGYYWRAIREDESAARSLGIKAFRYKVLAVALSAAMTAIGGGMFALLNGSLFPNSVMSMGMSIEIIIAPIIGGLGTLFGPIVGAFFMVPVMELSNHLGQSLGIFGLNTFVYGLLVFAVIAFLPDGLWPWLRRIVRLDPSGGTDASR